MKHYHITMQGLLLIILSLRGLSMQAQQATADRQQFQARQGAPDPLQIPARQSISGQQEVTAMANTPKGFKKGAVVLEDNTVLSGYIRDHIRAQASILFIPADGAKRRELDGGQIRSLQIDSTRFLCLKGDFFRVITDGELVFLQKQSDASGKPVYNGTEPLLINGTEGRPGDYFVYDNRQKVLRLVTKKTLGKVVTETFGNCTAAIDKAGTVHSDMGDLRGAIELYNSRNR